MNINELKRPFKPNQIHWRPGATNVDKQGNLKWGDGPLTIPLVYIDARDVMKRLDDVCGIEGWQVRYPFTGCCEIGVKVGDEWIWKSNGADESNMDGVKGQFSDAFKRAAVLWGIGRYLYYIKCDWTPYDAKRKKLTIIPPLPNWALPENFDAGT